MQPSSSRAIGAAIALAALLPAAAAYKYSFDLPLGGGGGQSAVVLSEGAMFQQGDGPFDKNGESYISYEGTAGATSPGYTAATSVNLWTAFYDLETKAAFGRPVEDDDEYSGFSYQYCCSPLLYQEGLCGKNTDGTNVAVGGLILYPDLVAPQNVAVNLTVLSVSVAGSPGLPVPISAFYKIRNNGPQYLLIVACDASSAGLPLPVIDVNLETLSFKNPYGWLPGQVVGLLGFWGTLFVAYLLLAAIYGMLMVYHRQFLILLQYCVQGVLVFSIIEAALWFFMYKSKNESGIPTPCSDCGSPSSDYLAAVVLSVLKRAVSRALILAVALGFGVVYPSLSRKVTAIIGALSFAYLICGTANELKKTTAYGDYGPSAWELPVMILDLLFLYGIWLGLERLMKDLMTANQTGKLKMYRRLRAVLVFNVLAWCIAMIANIMVRTRALPIAWSALFLLQSFWDLSYLLVVVAVAVIWLPGPESFQYSHYSQSANLEDDGSGNGGPGSAGGVVGTAGDIESGARFGSRTPSAPGEVEMTATRGGSAAGGMQKKAASQQKSAASAAAVARGSPIDDDEEDEGVDVEDMEISFSSNNNKNDTSRGAKAPPKLQRAGSEGPPIGSAPTSATLAQAPSEHFAIDEDEDEGQGGDKRKLQILAGPGPDLRPINPAAAALPAPAPAPAPGPAASGKKLAPPRAFSPQPVGTSGGGGGDAPAAPEKRD